MTFWTLAAVGFSILIIGVGVAARPGIGFALALIGIVFLISHFYLQMPMREGESPDRAYPRRLAALSIFMFLFLPHLIFKLGDIGLIIQFGIPLFVLLFANYHVLKSNNFKWRAVSTNTCIVLVVISILISMGYGYFLKGVPPNWRDILEIKAPIYYFLLFNMFFQMDWRKDEINRYFLVPFITGGMITVLIGIVQYFNPFAIDQTFFAYWTEEHHLKELLKPESRRIFSTFSASGIYGIFLIFLIAHLLTAFHGTRGVKRAIMLIYIILAVAALFMTGTKSSFVLFLALLVIYPLSFYRERFRAMTVSMSTVAAMLIITILIWPLISDSLIIRRMQDVSRSMVNVTRYGTSVRPEEYLDETSVGRYALYVMAAPWFVNSPVLGYGPAKNYLVYEDVHFEGSREMRFESSFLHLGVRYGVVGLGINMLLFINLLLIQRKTIGKKDISVELRRVASSHYSFAFLLLIAFLIGDFIYNIQLMSYLFASAGISASYLSKAQ